MGLKKKFWVGLGGAGQGWAWEPDKSWLGLK